MFLVFDLNGDIKSISPVKEEKLDKSLECIEIALSEVEDFLTAKKNIFDYYIKITNRAAVKSYTVTKKVSNISQARDVETALTEIFEDAAKKELILVTNNIPSKTITISLTREFEYTQLLGTDEELDKIQTFLNTPKSSLFFTKPGDPYFLLHTINFVPRELLNENKLVIKYKPNLAKASLFTQKLLDKYSYVIEKKNGV